MLNFQEIIGHDQIKEHFQKAIEYNKVSHAYILDCIHKIDFDNLCKTPVRREKRKKFNKKWE